MGPGLVPGIFIAAEALGLATVRSGAAAMYGVLNPQYGTDVWAEDLNALDVDRQFIPEPSSIVLLIFAAGWLCRRRAFPR